MVYFPRILTIELAFLSFLLQASLSYKMSCLHSIWKVSLLVFLVSTNWLQFALTAICAYYALNMHLHNAFYMRLYYALNMHLHNAFPVLIIIMWYIWGRGKGERLLLQKRLSKMG